MGLWPGLGLSLGTLNINQQGSLKGHFFASRRIPKGSRAGGCKQY